MAAKDMARTLDIDWRAGVRALESIAPLLVASRRAGEPPAAIADVAAAAANLKDIAARVATGPLRQRFESLPLAEFNPTSLDLLLRAAEAALYLDHRVNVERSRGGDAAALAEDLSRVWTLALAAYEETQAAARFLFRGEPELLATFRPAADLGR
jgi:hypothetical protein